MATYRQEYTVLAEAIVTNAIVVPTDAEVKAGEQPSLYYYILYRQRGVGYGRTVYADFSTHRRSPRSPVQRKGNIHGHRRRPGV